jgi:PHD/YefM family antitoxin component YafN of YafNO toxin-antitoxin module
MNKEFDEALQFCLDLIKDGIETIDSVVARYPEFEDELRSQLEIIMWLSTTSASLEPRPGFVAASKRRLVSRIRQEQQPVLDVPLTWGERLQQFLSVQKVAPVAFVGILMLALFVSGTVVSASQKSLPGDDLYPVKRSLEQIALATSLDDKNDAELQIQFVENRGSEVQALIVEERYEEVAETLQDYEQQVSKTLEVIMEVSDEDRFLAYDLAAQLDGILAEQKTILAVLSKNAPDSVGLNIARVWLISNIVELTTKDFANFVPPPPSLPPTPTSTAVPTRTPRPTPTLAPTQRPVLPSATPTKTKKPPTSPPPTDAPLPTTAPTSTPHPTNTPVPPTNTPVTPTNTPVPPTNTPVTPTNTPVTPTNTPVPPTNTPVPPTNTPVPPTNTPQPTSTPVTVSDSTSTPGADPTATQSP